MSEIQTNSIAGIITELEEIHSFLPQDIPTIQTLYEATRRGPKPTQAAEYLLLMAENAIVQSHKQAASFVLNALQVHFDNVAPPKFASVKSELEVTAGVGFTAENATGTIGYQGGRIDLIPELVLAWKLKDSQQLDSQEYSILVSELAQRTQQSHRGPISTLHALLGRDELSIEQIVATVIIDSGMPLISLTTFDLEMETVDLLPMDFITQRGVLPFETMQDDVLVALLNPYDELLKTEVLSRINQRCHFYMTSPDDFDAVIGSIISTEA